MQTKLNFIQFISLAYIFAIFQGLVAKEDTNSSDYAYMLSAMFVILLMFYYVLHGRKVLIHKISSTYSMIPLMMLLSWCYGVLMGVINSNSAQYIIRNNAGMVMYVMFFIFANMQLQTLEFSKFLLFCSRLALIMTFILGIMYNFSPFRNIPRFGTQTGIQDEMVTVLVAGRNLMFLAYARNLYDMLTNGSFNIVRVLEIIIVVLNVFFVMRSGGFQLAFLVLTLIFITFLSKNIKKPKIFIIFSTFIIIASIYLISTNASVLFSIFDRNDGGNSTRYRQIDYVMKNLSFFGRGFGATYYSIGRGYSIEIGYLDLVHKLGIFSVPVMLCYGYTLFESIRFLVKNSRTWLCVIPLSCISYFFVAMGNPVLFGVGSVFLHIIALMYLNSSFLEIDKPLSQKSFMLCVEYVHQN